MPHSGAYSLLLHKGGSDTVPLLVLKIQLRLQLASECGIGKVHPLVP